MARRATGAPPVSVAIRSARRSHSDAEGRSTSVGQEAKESRIGRSVSISCRQSAHAASCASATDTSLDGRARRACWRTRSEWPSPCRSEAELMAPSSRASACLSFRSPDRIRVFTVPSGWFSRAAVSSYVSSEKYAVSIACRSSGVRTVKALRSRRPCSLRSKASWGSLAAVAGSGCRAMVDALLPLLEPQPVDRPGPRLVHDPADDGAARSIVPRRAPPHVVKHVQRHLFGRFPIVGDPRH